MHTCVLTVAGYHAFKHTCALTVAVYLPFKHTCVLTVADVLSNIPCIPVCSQWLDVVLSNIPCIPVCSQWLDVVLSNITIHAYLPTVGGCQQAYPKIVMVCCIYLFFIYACGLCVSCVGVDVCRVHWKLLWRIFCLVLVVFLSVSLLQ